MARRAGRPVYLVDGARTPFLKARGRSGPFSAVDLAVLAGRPLLLRQPFAPDALDDVILGCAAPEPGEANPARVAALRLGLGERMPAWTVQRNCASGLQALVTGGQAIAEGRADLVLAGGAEALSRAPLLLSEGMALWLAGWMRARGPVARLRQLARLRPRHLVPVIALKAGLTDPVVGLDMGQTAEVLAHRFAITRGEMDAYALDSHRRLAAAQDEGRLADEIEVVFDRDGRPCDHDDGVRRDTGMAGLGGLRPAFEPPYGKVTAGNASQVTDGACWLILASEPAVERHGLTPMARVADSEWAALDPAEMGLGPVHATIPILRRRGLALGDVDAWELNEAFAAQVLACLAAWRDDGYCQENLGLDGAAGTLDRDRLNVDGGAIGIGHPVGASGARLVLHLAHVLRRSGGQRGIATLCVGGGQGGAVLLERV